MNIVMRIGSIAEIKLIMKVLSLLGRCIWWLFLASGPMFYVIDALFDWPYRIFFDLVIGYETLYFIFVFIAFIAVSSISKHFYRTALVILVIFGGTIESGMVRVAGFRNYVGNEKQYIRNHCDIQHFEMGGAVKSVGLCEWEKNDSGWLFGKGPDMQPFFYDTSGKIKDYYLFRTISHDQNKLRWVDAIRRLFPNDRDDPFERYSIIAEPIGDNFYGIFLNYLSLSDEVHDPGNAGFINDYGPLSNKN